MKRGKSEESQGRGLYMEDMGLSAEERKRALIGVITNVLAFAAIIVALRVGEEMGLHFTCIVHAVLVM
jgi:hypothetical protein